MFGVPRSIRGQEIETLFSSHSVRIDKTQLSEVEAKKTNACGAVNLTASGERRSERRNYSEAV